MTWSERPKTHWPNGYARDEFLRRYYAFPPVRSFPKPTQKPHLPIFLGSVTSPNVFKRIVAWGDGWMPVGVSLE